MFHWKCKKKKKSTANFCTRVKMPLGGYLDGVSDDVNVNPSTWGYLVSTTSVMWTGGWRYFCASESRGGCEPDKEVRETRFSVWRFDLANLFPKDAIMTTWALFNQGHHFLISIMCALLAVNETNSKFCLSRFMPYLHDFFKQVEPNEWDHGDFKTPAHFKVWRCFILVQGVWNFLLWSTNFDFVFRIFMSFIYVSELEVSTK